MRIKVREGTVDHSEGSLCETCRSATIIRGQRIGEEIVECQRLYGSNQRVGFHVASCSGYSDKRLPTLEQMESIAWILRSDPRRNQAGFVHPKQPAQGKRLGLGED